MRGPSLERWDDPALVGAYAGRPLAIVATGPSFDTLLPFGGSAVLARSHVFALNAALTEFQTHPALTWVCHDLHKIWKGGFRERVAGSGRWRLVARRVCVPGKFGHVPYRDVGGGTVRSRFAFPLGDRDFRRVKRWFWYAELPDQDGYLRAEETVLEVALRVAACWGFSPVLLVGADLSPVAGRAYAEPWAWKRSTARAEKWQAMRAALSRGHGRGEFPRDTFLLRGAWRDSPFPVVSPGDGARLLA